MGKKEQKEFVIEGLIDILIEDYSLEELNNTSFITQEMIDVYGVEPDGIETLLEGAREIKKLKENFEPLWISLIKGLNQVH